MRSVALIPLLAGAFAAAPAQVTTAPTTAASPRITTSASGEVRVTPDRAAVHVGVQTRATTAATAATDNARRQQAIIDTLKRLGLPAAQITTQNYNVSPQVQYDPQGRTNPKVTGYVVTNTVRVELRRIDQVGQVIDAALAKGANEIHGVEFSLSSADSARRVAIGDAVTRARADAEALARAAGGALGPLIELTTAAPAYRPVFAAMARGDAMMAAQAAPTPVEPGQQTVQVTVSAAWAFTPR
jgi:uncharacterized protein YggE